MSVVPGHQYVDYCQKGIHESTTTVNTNVFIRRLSCIEVVTEFCLCCGPGASIVVLSVADFASFGVVQWTADE